MLTQILQWVSTAGQLILLLSVIIWGLYFRKMPKAIHFLGIYLVLNLIVQLIAFLLWKQSLNNLSLLHLNTLLEFVFISLFFKEVYIDQHFFKKHFTYIITGISLLLFLNSIFIEPLNSFNSNAKILVQVCLISYVIIYFFDTFGRVDLSQRKDQAISFICFSILLFYSGSLVTFMFGNLIVGDEVKEGIRPIWLINGFLTLVFQLILLGSFLRIAFQPQEKDL